MWEKGCTGREGEGEGREGMRGRRGAVCGSNRGYNVVEGFYLCMRFYLLNLTKGTLEKWNTSCVCKICGICINPVSILWVNSNAPNV